MKLLEKIWDSPLGKRVAIVLIAGAAAALSTRFPAFERYVELAAAAVVGGQVMKRAGDEPAPKKEESE